MTFFFSTFAFCFFFSAFVMERLSFLKEITPLFIVILLGESLFLFSSSETSKSSTSFSFLSSFFLRLYLNLNLLFFISLLLNIPWDSLRTAFWAFSCSRRVLRSFWELSTWLSISLSSPSDSELLNPSKSSI